MPPKRLRPPARRIVATVRRDIERARRRLAPRIPDRRSLLVGPLDLGGRGLEFGPLTRPIVSKSEGDVRYVDHLSTDGLRAKYEMHAHVDLQAICEVDYVLDPERTLSAIVGSGYDYVIASHVIEHVPNLLGWLDEITRILAPGGILALAAPDKRTTFDVMRPVTVPSDLIAAAMAEAVQPTVQQVLEHHLFAMRKGPDIMWSTPVDRTRLNHVHDLGYALQQAELAASGSYVDAHCWVFTPTSFETNIRVLRDAGVTRMGLLSPPVELPGEFIVHLRVDSEVDPVVPPALKDDWDIPFSF